MLLRVTLIAVTIAASSIGFASPSPANACRSGYYKAASGDCVHRPVCNVPTRPPDATVQCPDGCWSFSEHPDDDDTCHGHNRAA